MVGAGRDAFREYLARIGMAEPMVERAEEVLANMRRFIPEVPEYLFVSDYRDEEGHRNYNSLWVLTESYMSEAREFVTQGNFDIVRRDTGLSHLRVDHDDFDFEEPREVSRLTIRFAFSRDGSGLGGELLSSGSNCTDLQEILEGYLLPTMESLGA